MSHLFDRYFAQASEKDGLISLFPYKKDDNYFHQQFNHFTVPLYKTPLLFYIVRDVIWIVD